MRAGLLRHRLAIVSSTGSTVDILGQPVTANSTVTTVWGSVEPLTGQERWRAQQIQPEVTHKITVRYTSDLVPNRHVEHDGRSFQILSVMDKDERKIEQTAMAKERI